MSETAAAQAVAEELVKARMLAAEREHELVELRSRLQRYEDEIINLPQDEEDELDMEATELWLSGNAHISEGNVAEGVSAYTSSMSSLLRRFQDLKSRVAARDLVAMEVKQKWMADKDNELQLAREEFQQQIKQHELALQQREEWIETKQQEFSEERMRWEESQSKTEAEFAQERETLLAGFQQERETLLASAQQERSRMEEEFTRERETLLAQERSRVEEVVRAEFQQERETLLAAAQQELAQERSRAEEAVRAEFAKEKETLLAAAQQELVQERSRVEEAVRAELQQERETLLVQERSRVETELTQERDTLVAAAKQELEDTRNKLQSHEEQTAQLLKKYQALKEEHKTLKRQTVDLQSQISQLEADALVKQQDLDLAKENCIKAQNESIELTNQVFELEAELTQGKVQQESRLAQLQQQLASTKLELASEASEIAQLRQQVASGESEITQLRQQAAGGESEITQLRHQLACTAEQMEYAGKEGLAVLQQEISSSALALQALQLELASQAAKANEQCAALASEHTLNMETQHAKWQQDAELKRDQLVQAQNENIELNDQVFELQAEQQQMVNATLELKHQVETANQHLQQALTENQALRSAAIAADDHTLQIDQLQCEVNELTFQLDTLHVCNAAQIDTIKTQAKERVEKIQREAKARMNKTRQETSALVEQTKAEHEQELLQLRTRLQECDGSNNLQIASVQSENAALTLQVNQLETDKATLTQQLAALQTDKTVLDQQLAALQDDKATLADQVSALETNKAALTDQLSKLESENTMLNGQLGKLQVDTHSQLAAAQAETVSLSQQRNALQHDLSACKQALESETTALAQVNADLVSKQAQLAHAQQQVEHVQVAHNELQLKLDSLVQESLVEQTKWKLSVESLQNDNISLNDQIFELQAEAAANSNKPSVDDAQFIDLSRQLFELQEEISPLRSTITQLKQEIAVLQSDNAKCNEANSAAKQAEFRLECEAQKLEQLTVELLLDVQGLQLELEQAHEQIQIVDQDKRLCEIAIEDLHCKLEQQQRPPSTLRRGLNLVSNEARIHELESMLRTSGEQNSYLEQELKRNRHEFQFNTQNLQSECEALRRRLEELGLAEESRNRSGSLDQGSAKKKPLPPHHMRHTTFLLPHYQETPESQGRMRPRRNSMLEMRPNGGDLEVVGSAPAALSELKRARQEFALTTKNLQSECEALRRRVEELELELEAKSELLQSYPASQDEAAVTKPPSFVRSFSEVESQRNGGGNAWLPLETPESRRLYDTSTSSASPVAFRLDVDEEEEEGKPAVVAAVAVSEEEVIGLRSRIAELEAVLVELEADRDYRVAQVEEELAVMKKELEAKQEPSAENGEEVERLEMRVRELELQVPRSDEVTAALHKLLELKQNWHGAMDKRFVELEQQATALVSAVQALELQRNAVQDQLKATFGAEEEEEPAAEPNAALKIAQELANALTPPHNGDEDKVELVINQVRACLLPCTTATGAKEDENWVQIAKQLEKEKRELVNRLRRSEAELASRVEFFSHSNLYAQPQHQPAGSSRDVVVMQTPIRDNNTEGEQDRSRLDVTPWKNAAYSNSSAASKRSDWSASSKPPPAWNYDADQQHSYEDWPQQHQQADQTQQQEDWQQDWQQPQEQEWQQQPQEQDWQQQQQDGQWQADPQQAEPPQQQQQAEQTSAPPAAPPKMPKPGKKSGPSVLAKAFGIGSYHPEWKPDPKELDEDNSDFEETAQATVAAEQLPASTPESGEEWFHPPPVQEYEPRGSWQGDVTTEEIWGGNGDATAAAAAVQDWNNGQQWTEHQAWQDADVTTPPAEQQEWQQQHTEEQQWQQEPQGGYVEQTPQKPVVAQMVNENVLYYPNGEDELLAKRIHELKEELSLEREARLLRESQCESFESTLSLVRRDAEILKAELYSMECKHQEEIESLAAQLEYAKQHSSAVSHNENDVIVYTSMIQQQDTVTLVVNNSEETAALETKLSEALETIHALRHQISQLELAPAQQQATTHDDTTLLQEQIKLREHDVEHLISQLSRVTYDLLSAEEQAKKSSPATTASFAMVAFALSALIPPQAIAQRVVQMFQMV